MNWFRNWKIKTKILALIVLMATFIGTVGFVGYYYNAKASVQMTNIYSNNLLSVKYVKKVTHSDAHKQKKMEVRGSVTKLVFQFVTDPL